MASSSTKRAVKCCVGGCSSTNVTHKLIMLPQNDKLRSLWMSFLVPTNSSLLGLSKNQLVTKRVCEKHFDDMQFDVNGERIRYSYPCLFSEKEIAHDIPLNTEKINTPNKDVPGISKTVFTHVSILHGLMEDWTKMQDKGTKICKVISALNLHEFEQDYYPQKLMPLMENLLDLINSLNETVESIELVANKLRAISQLQPGNQPVIFTWSASKLYQEVYNIFKSLEKEIKLKKTITENIAHTRDKCLIEVYVSSWEFNVYFDINASSYLFAEFGLNGIT